MAIAQSDGSIVLTTKVDQSGLKKGMSSFAASAKKMASTAVKAFLAIGAAATAATVSIVKSSVDAFAEYEQLVGGVETLFKDSSKKLIKYANEAYKTTGQSANEYMQNVTSFSASLLSAVSGDTEKAAEIANAAMISISDNVNKMGSSAESVTMAFQGFAKQQYMLLDNLKLGYGGTKTEMERLLKDAQAITGVEYNIDNLADVYTAIGVIQEKLGIAGTTAKEAATTISGSAATMKAAWQNVLTAISGGGDLDQAINNLVDSISIYFENIVPVVERALSGIGRLIEKVSPMLVQTVAKSLIKAIPSLLNAVYEMIIGLAKGIYQGIIDLFNGTSREVLTEQADNIEQSVENQNDLTKAVKETGKEVKKTVAGFDDIEILTRNADENILDQVFNGDSNNIITEEIIQEKETEKAKEFGVALENIVALGKMIKSVFSELKEPLTALWNDALYPIINWLVKEIGYVISKITESFNVTSENFSKFKTEFSQIIEFISAVIQIIWSVLKPITQATNEILFGTLKPIISAIFNIISALGNFLSAWKNIISAVIELFKGNTDTAREYAKNALADFANMWIGIANAIIGVINSLWTVIFNSFKGAVNSVGGFINKIADFVGFDLNLEWNAKVPLIPEIQKYIPKLAQGTVVPPNREFLAVLGDNKKENEIVSPVSTMKQAFIEAMLEMGGNFGSGNTEVVLEIDGREFGRAVVEQGNRENRRIGTRLVIA